MAALPSRRRTATIRAARTPDDRAVVGCALSALAALLLMLLAGTAKSDEPELVCWNLESGALACESGASIAATCAATDARDEICTAAQSVGTGAPLPLPGENKYTIINLTRPAKEIFIRSKPHVN